MEPEKHGTGATEEVCEGTHRRSLGSRARRRVATAVVGAGLTSLLSLAVLSGSVGLADTDDPDGDWGIYASKVDVSEGDEVLYSKFVGTDIVVEGEDLLVSAADEEIGDVIAV